MPLPDTDVIQCPPQDGAQSDGDRSFRHPITDDTSQTRPYPTTAPPRLATVRDMPPNAAYRYCNPNPSAVIQRQTEFNLQIITLANSACATSGTASPCFSKKYALVESGVMGKTRATGFDIHTYSTTMSLHTHRQSDSRQIKRGYSLFTRESSRVRQCDTGFMKAVITGIGRHRIRTHTDRYSTDETNAIKRIHRICMHRRGNSAFFFLRPTYGRGSVVYFEPFFMEDYLCKSKAMLRSASIILRINNSTIAYLKQPT